MEIPPSNPSRSFRVFLAISSPRGTVITTLAPPGRPCWPSASRTDSAIILSGVLVMDAFPISIPSPAFVTRATPSAPSTSTAPPSVSHTSATISAPWVQSGSSPASLITEQTAESPRRSDRSTANVTRWPMGSPISTSRTTCPESSALAAALAAAAAQAPVVNPVRIPFFFAGASAIPFLIIRVRTRHPHPALSLGEGEGALSVPSPPAGERVRVRGCSSAMASSALTIAMATVEPPLRPGFVM